jgi:exosortase family protein XrtF
MSGSYKFVIYFLLCFVGLNIAYHFLFIKQGNELDFFTNFIAKITANLYGLPTQLNPLKPGIQIIYNGTPLVNIMEGCNGLVVWFTLLSFVVAFGGKAKQFLGYVPLSFVLLQVGNILRILALVHIKINNPNSFSFFHSYAFPAILYAFAFGLMLIWIKLQARNTDEKAS